MRERDIAAQRAQYRQHHQHEQGLQAQETVQTIHEIVQVDRGDAGERQQRDGDDGRRVVERTDEAPRHRRCRKDMHDQAQADGQTKAIIQRTDRRHHNASADEAVWAEGARNTFAANSVGMAKIHSQARTGPSPPPRGVGIMQATTVRPVELVVAHGEDAGRQGTQ